MTHRLLTYMTPDLHHGNPSHWPRVASVVGVGLASVIVLQFGTDIGLVIPMVAWWINVGSDRWVLEVGCFGRCFGWLGLIASRFVGIRLILFCWLDLSDGWLFRVEETVALDLRGRAKILQLDHLVSWLLLVHPKSQLGQQIIQPTGHIVIDQDPLLLVSLVSISYQYLLLVSLISIAPGQCIDIMGKLNKVKERLVYLAPAVQAGWDDESSIGDFNVIELLGKGSFGRVKKVKHKKTGKVYAIKEIEKKEIKLRKMVEQVKNELKIMYSLNHPNIVKLYSHFEDDFSIYLIMEYAENGHLYSYLMKSPKKRLPEEEAQRFISQLVAAVEYIHLRSIIHRDIKPENILIDSKMNVKLCDFGWSNFERAPLKRTTFCGTLDYLAPEMLLAGHEHDSSVDIWAVGVLIYEICSGNSPFSFGLNDDKPETEKRVRSNILDVKFTPSPAFFSQSCKDLIARILKKNPKERPSIKEIQESPWLLKALDIGAENKDYSQELRKQFEVISEEKDKTFTKEEIYAYSRLESVINKKESDQAEKDIRPVQLEPKIRELQLKRAQDQQQLYRLRKFRQQHTECEKRILEMQKSYVLLKGQMDDQYMKLMASESRVRELEMHLSKLK